MNEKQAILKFRSIRSYLTDAHLKVTQKYREKNEVQRRKRELKKQKESEKLHRMINTEMEDSIHMV